MRILLDECVPHRLRKEIDFTHDVVTVQFLGWKGVTNGALIRRMVAAGIDVLVTTDRHVHEQQNIAASGIAMILLFAPSNGVEDIAPFMPHVNAALATIIPGEVREIRG